ncbi:hypothetical protein DIPPA_32652 [Diplonema papillatum]|nr:hypothetical protein DIPPA_32652 [Diplonema papillatum]
MAAGDAAAAEAVLLSFGSGAAPSLGKVLAACHSSASVARLKAAGGAARAESDDGPLLRDAARTWHALWRKRLAGVRCEERELRDARLSPHATPEEVRHYARRGHQLARDEEAAALGDALMVTLRALYLPDCACWHPLTVELVGQWASTAVSHGMRPKNLLLFGYLARDLHFHPGLPPSPYLLSPSSREAVSALWVVESVGLRWPLAVDPSGVVRAWYARRGFAIVAIGEKSASAALTSARLGGTRVLLEGNALDLGTSTLAPLLPLTEHSHPDFRLCVRHVGPPLTAAAHIDQNFHVVTLTLSLTESAEVLLGDALHVVDPEAERQCLQAVRFSWTNAAAVAHSRRQLVRQLGQQASKEAVSATRAALSRKEALWRASAGHAGEWLRWRARLFPFGSRLAVLRACCCDSRLRWAPEEAQRWFDEATRACLVRKARPPESEAEANEEEASLQRTAATAFAHEGRAPASLYADVDCQRGILVPPQPGPASDAAVGLFPAAAGFSSSSSSSSSSRIPGLTPSALFPAGAGASSSSSGSASSRIPGLAPSALLPADAGASSSSSSSSSSLSSSRIPGFTPSATGLASRAPEHGSCSDPVSGPSPLFHPRPGKPSGVAFDPSSSAAAAPGVSAGPLAGCAQPRPASSEAAQSKSGLGGVCGVKRARTSPAALSAVAGGGCAPSRGQAGPLPPLPYTAELGGSQPPELRPAVLACGVTRHFLQHPAAGVRTKLMAHLHAMLRAGAVPACCWGEFLRLCPAAAVDEVALTRRVKKALAVMLSQQAILTQFPAAPGDVVPQEQPGAAPPPDRRQRQQAAAVASGRAGSRVNGAGDKSAAPAATETEREETCAKRSEVSERPNGAGTPRDEHDPSTRQGESQAPSSHAAPAAADPPPPPEGHGNEADGAAAAAAATAAAAAAGGGGPGRPCATPPGVPAAAAAAAAAAPAAPAAPGGGEPGRPSATPPGAPAAAAAAAAAPSRCGARGAGARGARALSDSRRVAAEAAPAAAEPDVPGFVEWLARGQAIAARLPSFVEDTERLALTCSWAASRFCAQELVDKAGCAVYGSELLRCVGEVESAVELFTAHALRLRRSQCLVYRRRCDAFREAADAALSDLLQDLDQGYTHDLDNHVVVAARLKRECAILRHWQSVLHDESLDATPLLIVENVLRARNYPVLPSEPRVQSSVPQNSHQALQQARDMNVILDIEPSRIPNALIDTAVPVVNP